jgi:hypothetical protein
LHFISHLHAGIDKIVMQAEQRGVAPACKAACNRCCYLRVEASQAEVLLIARHLRQATLPQLQAVRQRLLQRQQHMQAATAPFAPLACAFLQDDLCSIYPCARPAVARRIRSLPMHATPGPLKFRRICPSRWRQKPCSVVRLPGIDRLVWRRTRWS